MTGLIQDQNLEKHIEKQIGCMSGFLHIFDRQQILAGKRIHSTKRLPPSTGAAESPESDKSVQPETRNFEKPVPAEPVVTSSPAKKLNVFPTSTPPRSQLLLPVFELEGSVKTTSWKFCKEMPRLSLDSRATVDSKGSLCRKEIPTENGSFEKQPRSPSVIARLMGVDQLPSSGSLSPVKKPELRRSASESRVSRDFVQSRFVDGDSFQTKKPNQTNRRSVETTLTSNNLTHTSPNQHNENAKTSQLRHTQQRLNFFDSTDFFPATKQAMVRTIDQQSNDLEALKHMLEAMQLKGLLHSKQPLNRNSRQNFVYDRRLGNYGGVNRYSGEVSPAVSPRKERRDVDRSGRSPVRARNQQEKRVSPIKSPKLTPKRAGSEHQSVTNRSPRSKRSAELAHQKKKVYKTAFVDDESTSISESSGSTTSQSDPERLRTVEYRDGKDILARCDKLLHTIAEMNIITESHTSSNSVLPSPVSVLDSAFDKEESSSPSPVMKRSIDFSDLTVDPEEDDDIWSSIISPTNSTEDDEFISCDSDFTYISEILRLSKHHVIDSSIFNYLETKRTLTKDEASTESKLRRKLVFDIVVEILSRNRNLKAWNSVLLTESNSNNSVKQICLEFEKIREAETVENFLDLISLVLKRDLARGDGWGDQPVEISEAVLYIERLIFKDLVSETIRDLVEVAGKTRFFAPRRKLFF